MESEYTTIKIKKEYVSQLKEAVNVINSKEGALGKKTTVAGLVARLADSYDTQMSRITIAGNREGWIADGIPVILDSDASKHFVELKEYFPCDCSVMISNVIRTMAMEERMSRISSGDNK